VAPDTAFVELAVVPRASADHVGPYAAGTLRVRVTRAPVDGAANRAVVRLVARALSVSPGAVRLVSGERGRRKRVAVDGLSADELERRLAALAD
jgi:uncharacterized protein